MKSDIGYNPNSSNQVTLSDGVFKHCTSSLGGVIYAKNDDKNLHLQVNIIDSDFHDNFARELITSVLPRERFARCFRSSYRKYVICQVHSLRALSA